MNPSPPAAITATDTVSTSASVSLLESDELGRAIEVGCTYPDSGPIRGVIVWCHGLGGSRESGDGLASVWSARGYVVVLPTFGDSIELVARRHPELGLDPHDGGHDRWALDDRVRAFMLENMLDWPWRHDRMTVLRCVIDACGSLLADEPRLASHVDSARLGVGGHSFGAYVSQLVAGAVVDCPLGPATSFRDERVKAVVIASGQGRPQAGLRNGSWDRVELPLLNVTGTRDRGATSDDPAWKREPFHLSPPGAKYQVVIDDADHGLGGIAGASRLYPARSDHRQIVERISGAFWDAFLAEDQQARAWLDSERPSALLGDAATFERR